MPNQERILDLYVFMCKAGEGFCSYIFLKPYSSSECEQVITNCLACTDKRLFPSLLSNISIPAVLECDAVH